MKKTEGLIGDVYNIDVFQILLNYEVSRSRRYPCPQTLIQIEVTPITLTAEANHAALMIFSAALNATLRSSDIPARSGNLFTVLLPNSDKHGANVVCERLLSVFRNKFEDENGNSIIFSLHIGATTHLGGESINSNELLEKSREALEQSQRKGANTFVFIS
jgi:GGDEF domain-containing protein